MLFLLKPKECVSFLSTLVGRLRFGFEATAGRGGRKRRVLLFLGILLQATCLNAFAQGEVSTRTQSNGFAPVGAEKVCVLGEAAEVDKTNEMVSQNESGVIPVIFPGVLPKPNHSATFMPKTFHPNVGANPESGAGSDPGQPGNAAPTLGANSYRNTHVAVSIMKGEVHLRNLNSKMGTGEILNVSTGNRSACEFKLGQSNGRVWQDSNVTVFGSSNLIMLNSGELILRVSRSAAEEFTVIAGDLLCRVRGTTVHVSRSDRDVKFKVLEGTVTVFNRQTGEVLKVAP